MMSHFFSDPDPEFQRAGVQAYNDWIAEEFVKVAPDRLIGLACMPALGVKESIREMERCLKLGMRGVWKRGDQHAQLAGAPRWRLRVRPRIAYRALGASAWCIGI